MVETIKDLERLLKLLRKQGVTKMSLNGLVLDLGDLPVRTSQIEEPEEEYPDPFSVPLTNEELVSFANGVD